MNKTIVWIIFAVVLVALTQYAYVQSKKKVEFKKPIETNATMLKFSDKANCNMVNTTCFDTTDCNLKCTNSNSICSYGSCIQERILPKSPTKCDVTKGMIAYLVGDVKVGEYNFVCKSVDPGIAVSNHENAMCLGGDINIDYLSHYPSISDCKCAKPEDLCIIPATKVKRQHVQCSSTFAKIVHNGL